MKWKEEKGIGNVIKQYHLYASCRGEDVGICTILVFTKGEFVLPTNIFPRHKLMPQKTKTLDAAKSKCEKWFSDFIKQNNELLK